MTAAAIVEELKQFALLSYKATMLKHGAKEPILGVKIEELKKIQKRIKQDYQLSLELYETGISEAMYLAGMIADDAAMTKKDLQRWVDRASWKMIGTTTVASVAAGNAAGWDLALKWIDSKKELVAATGWATITAIISTRPDADLDLVAIKSLLQRVEKTIHQERNEVRSVMNGFVIAVGSYVTSLTGAALKTADAIGRVEVDVGETACQVPDARAYIEKIQGMGRIGRKRKSAKC